ncbi:MAG: hypothetical protein AAGU11_12145 [Syntrophobacteraceae bacterium]
MKTGPVKSGKAKPVVQKVLLIMAYIAFGLAVGSGYGYYSLTNARHAFDHSLKEVEKKVAQVQHVAREEKNRVMNLEGQNRALQAEIGKLQKEKSSLEAEAMEFEGKLRLAAEKMKELEEAAARAAVKVDYAAIEKRCAELARVQVDQVAKRCESAIEQLNSQKQLVEAALRSAKEDFDRCAGSNRELCSIAKDILNKYENKGFFNKVMEKEPFTQLKKVEIEKLVQDYGKKISENEVKTDKPQ